MLIRMNAAFPAGGTAMYNIEAFFIASGILLWAGLAWEAVQYLRHTTRRLRWAVFGYKRTSRKAHR